MIHYTFARKDTKELLLVDYGYITLFPKKGEAEAVIGSLQNWQDYEVVEVDLQMKSQDRVKEELTKIMEEPGRKESAAKVEESLSRISDYLKKRKTQASLESSLLLKHLYDALGSLYQARHEVTGPEGPIGDKYYPEMDVAKFTDIASIQDKLQTLIRLVERENKS